MLASRHLLFIPLLVCFMAAWASAQEVRKWTDTNGKTLDGKFVELTADDKVKIDSGGQVYTIPLSAFIAEDQKYARTMSANSGKPDKPAADPFKEPDPKDAQALKELEDTRLWTDYKGTTVTAHFLRMFDGKVALMHGNKSYKLSFHELSPEDQAWLRKRLALKGQANKILPRDEMEKLDPTMAAAHQKLDQYVGKNPVTTSNAGNRGTMDNGSSRPNPSSSLYKPPTQDLYTPPSNNSDNSVPYSPPSDGTTMLPDISTAGQEEDVAMNTTPEGQNPGARPDSGGSNFPNRFSNTPQQNVPPGFCPGCNKELPVGYGPGDHCPRCNFYLESWVQPGNGAPLVPWYQSSTIWYVGGAVILIALFGMFGAKKFG
ncbi:hypothetical protein [Blastopirellula marina]|uniref:SLA1 homology domain-containing protein n=1 Tax=Blastopirellula marina TaxID=124 RepID=A0A2S8GCZ2_9BACT|nr:hypothetical protein [Blastopirellula marina]PQO42328.1 hypothetical protein C5Y93_28750 [Blastopirellula marina]